LVVLDNEDYRQFQTNLPQTPARGLNITVAYLL
jgi:hypothetical protein